MSGDEIEEIIEELADDLDGILGRHNSRFNLSTSTPKETPMATANTTDRTILGIKLPLEQYAEAGLCIRAIEEYHSNHHQLRRDGVSLESYVRTWRKDQGNNDPLPSELSAALATLQSSLGGVASPANPLAPV